MHLPDGFVNNQISIGLMAVAVGFLVLSFVRVRKLLFNKVVVMNNKLALADGLTSESNVSQKWKLADKEKVELMFMLGVLIFVFQYFDFPILGGHLLGGTLLAVTLGPWLGLIVISIILIIQALLGDGGIVTLGINIFNIGIITIFSSWFFYKLFKSINISKYLNIAITSWLAVVLASIPYSLLIGNFTEIKFYLIIGVLEALMTVLIIKYLKINAS